jgi:Putative prokaryotic signal transducing protein
VDEDAVVVAVAENEPEAEMLCGLLRDAGIDCGYRDTAALDSTIEDFTAAGPREILVHRDDLERARALLPAS